MTEWMTIDSAPRDGTVILAYWPQVSHPFVRSEHLPAVFMSHYFKWTKDDPWRWEAQLSGHHALPRFSEDQFDSQPTHWMKLPAPPQGEQT